MRALKWQLIRVIAAALLLVALSVLEPAFVQHPALPVPVWLMEQVFLALFVAAALALAFFTARIVLKVGGLVATSLSVKPKFKPLQPLLRTVFAVASFVTFLVLSLRVVAYRIATLAGVAEWLSQALTGFFSMLIALILAMQVKEIVGNYLAWIVIRASGLVEPGDYVSFSGEVFKVVRVGYSHTLMVNSLNEEIYIPNLKFLLETYRKSFSPSTRKFIELRFRLPYSYPLEEVKAGVARALERYSERHDSVAITEYRLLIYELSPYSVTYELRVKPAKPVFPMLLRSGIMAELLREFGEALSAPMLLSFAHRKPTSNSKPNQDEGAGEQAAS